MISQMTLKIRNRFLKIFVFISIACILSSAISLILGLLNATMLPPPIEIRVLGNFGSSFLASYKFSATIISIIILIFFVPLATFSIIKFFRKTQASEIVFLLGFFIGILCESLRLMVISTGMWQTFSDLLLAVGRIIVFGRTLAFLSFFFSSLMSSASQRQSLEKNFLIMIAISALISILTPINTARITSTGMPTIGFSNMYSIFSILIILLTVITFIYNGKKQEQIGFYKLAGFFLALMVGYEILLNSDCMIELIVGTFLLFLGLFEYLLSVHKIYIWQ